MKGVYWMCDLRGCDVWAKPMDDVLALRVEHGHSGEAVKVFPYPGDLTKSHLQEQVHAWLDSVHKYEDALVRA